MPPPYACNKLACTPQDERQPSNVTAQQEDSDLNKIAAGQAALPWSWSCNTGRVTICTGNLSATAPARQAVCSISTAVLRIGSGKFIVSLKARLCADQTPWSITFVSICATSATAARASLLRRQTDRDKTQHAYRAVFEHKMRESKKQHPHLAAGFTG